MNLRSFSLLSPWALGRTALWCHQSTRISTGHSVQAAASVRSDVSWIWGSVCFGQAGFFSWYKTGKAFSVEFFQPALMPPRAVATNGTVAMVSALTRYGLSEGPAQFGVGRESALPQVSRDSAGLLPLGLSLGSSGQLPSNAGFGQLEGAPQNWLFSARARVNPLRTRALETLVICCPTAGVSG